MSSSPEFEEKKKEEEEEARPLDPALQARAEAALGHGLGRVRVRRDRAAQEKADALGARAFTKGEEVYFARGEYTPSTEEGARLLFHELAHTLQQRGAGQIPAERDALEAEAEAAAATAARGGRAPVRLKAAAGQTQKQSKSTSATPTIQRHAEEITATPPQGTLAGGGFSIPYIFNVVKDAVSVPLVLHVPDGVSVTVTPLTDLPEGDYRVQNAAGAGARSVVITVGSKMRVPPKLQVTFGRPSASYVVVFQFPVIPGK